MIRPTTARIDLAALTSNYRQIVEFLGREEPSRPPGVIAVVKANAYGHGAGQIARALEAASQVSREIQGRARNDLSAVRNVGFQSLTNDRRLAGASPPGQGHELGVEHVG